MASGLAAPVWMPRTGVTAAAARLLMRPDRPGDG